MDGDCIVTLAAPRTMVVDVPVGTARSEGPRGHVRVGALHLRPWRPERLTAGEAAAVREFAAAVGLRVQVQPLAVPPPVVPPSLGAVPVPDVVEAAPVVDVVEAEPVSDPVVVVSVGVMEAVVDPGPDGELGTGDDETTVRRASEAPASDEESEETSAGMAPRRTRSRSRKGREDGSETDG